MDEGEDGDDVTESLVTSLTGTVSNLADSLINDAADAVAAATEIDDDEAEEWITLSETSSYLGPLLKSLAIIHTLFSLSMLIAYYFLKVSRTIH